MTFVKQEIQDYVSINVDELNPFYKDVDPANILAYELYVYDNFIWKAVIDAPEDVPSIASVNWVKWGPSNKYAAIDERSRTATVATNGDIVMVIPWSAYNTLILGGVVSSNVNIQLSDHSDPTFQNPIWTEDIKSAERRCVTGWFKYFNVDRSCPVSSVGNDEITTYVQVPPNIIGFMQLTFTQSSVHQITKASIVLAGRGFYAGCTILPVGLGIDDFSNYITDEWGTSNIVRRNNRRARDYESVVDTIDVLRIEDYVQSELLGTTFISIADESANSIYNNMVLLGYLDDFSSTIREADKQVMKFNIKEII